MFKGLNKHKFFLLAALVANVVSVYAATTVQISSLTDMNFGTLSIVGNSSQNSNICIYNSSGSGNYTVTATNAGSSNPFYIANSNHHLPYTVKWNNKIGTTGNLTLSPNVKSPTFTGASNVLKCNNGSDANLQIIFNQSDVVSAIAGNYTGILQLLIAPA